MKRRVAIEERLAMGQVGDAERANADLEKAYPSLANADASFCDHWYAKRSYAKARKACARAADKDKNAGRPRALLGSIALTAGQIDAGIRYLEDATRCSTSTLEVWVMLRAAYLARGKREGAASVERRYKEHFSESL